MLFDNLFRASVVTCFTTIAVVACGEPENEGSSRSKQPAEIACEHMNDLCSGVEGYRTQDCAGTEAAYASLEPSQQDEVDALVPCIMAAKTCEPAVQCLQPAAESSGSAGSSKSDKSQTTEDACEHINDICAETDGFETQDCSKSNDDYESLSDNDKALADSIVPCVMDAEGCETAFKCLDVQK